MSKFKVGDKVRVRAGVHAEECYNKLDVTPHMLNRVFTVESTGEDDVYVNDGCGKHWYIGDDALELIGQNRMTYEQKREFVSAFCKIGSCDKCPCCTGGKCLATSCKYSTEELDDIIVKIDSAGLNADEVHVGCWPSSQAYLAEHSEKPTHAAERKAETVNHPDHYQGEHECIEIMRAMFGDEAVKGFCRCNAYKYRFRADQKGGEEDLRKACWYEDYLIKMEAEHEDR